MVELTNSSGNAVNVILYAADFVSTSIWNMAPIALLGLLSSHLRLDLASRPSFHSSLQFMLSKLRTCEMAIFEQAIGGLLIHRKIFLKFFILMAELVATRGVDETFCS